MLRTKRFLSFLLVCLSVFAADEGLFRSRVTLANQGQAPAVELRDFRGKSLVLQKPAERIVCLIESALSGIYMLGAEERVVGVSASVYEEETFPFYAAMDERIRFRRLPVPGNWDFINMERLVALRPDLVIIWAHQEEAIRAVEERGIPVFGVFIRSFEDVFQEVLALGSVTGTRDRAHHLVAQTRGALAQLLEKTSSIPYGDRVRVYYMWAQGDLETSGKPSTVDELITMAGATNVCSSIEQEHLIISMEKLLKWDPQVIVMWANSRRDPADILSNPAWQSVSAVRSRRVHEFPEIFSCDLWTLKFQYAVKMVAKWCYPELFSDPDLEAEKLDLCRQLYGERPSLFELLRAKRR